MQGGEFTIEGGLKIGVQLFAEFTDDHSKLNGKIVLSCKERNIQRQIAFAFDYGTYHLTMSEGIERLLSLNLSPDEETSNEATANFSREQQALWGIFTKFVEPAFNRIAEAARQARRLANSSAPFDVCMPQMVIPQQARKPLQTFLFLRHPLKGQN